MSKPLETLLGEALEASEQRAPLPRAELLAQCASAGDAAELNELLDVLEEGAPPHGLDLSDFELRQTLGSGGQGSVVLARQKSLEREVAIKFLAPAAVRDPRAKARLWREARAVAALEHPAFVKLYGVGIDSSGHPFLVMERAHGCTLLEAVHALGPEARHRAAATDERGEARAGEATAAGYRRLCVRWIAEAAEAMEVAHRRGVVHRDLQPRNLWIEADGRLRILDFGLARRSDTAALGSSGELWGVPPYVAPEQYEGTPTRDPRVDLYALGAVLYELLAGAPTFAGAREGQVRAALAGEPAGLRRHAPEVERDLETICATALRRVPAERYASAGAFAADLRAVLEGRPILARPIGRIERAWKLVRRSSALRAALGTAIALLVFLLAILLWHAESTRGERVELLSRGRSALARIELDAAEHELAELERRDASSAEAVSLRFETELARLDDALRRACKLLERLHRIHEEIAALQTIVAATPGAEVRASREKKVERYRQELRYAEAQVDRERLVLEMEAATAEAESFARTLRANLLPVQQLRAEIALSRWRHATAVGNPAVAEAIRELYLELGVEERVRAVIDAPGHLQLLDFPTSAHLFLYRETPWAKLCPEDALPRLVHVPTRGPRESDARALPDGQIPGSIALEVEHVESGGVAEACGLREGDVILRIGGVAPDLGIHVLASDGGTDLRRGDRLQLIEAQRADGSSETWEVASSFDLLRLLRPPPARPWARAVIALRRGEAALERGLEMSAFAPRGTLHLGRADEWLSRGVEAATSLRIVREAEILELELPRGEAGMIARFTRNALWRLPGYDLGGSAQDLSLPPGRYLALVEHASRERERLSFRIDPGQLLRLPVPARPRGSRPPGFVAIGGGTVALAGDPEAIYPRAALALEVQPFFLAQREVTIGEYARFLADPAVAERVFAHQAKTGQWILVPRRLSGTRFEPRFEVDAARNTIAPGVLDPDWPVADLSHDDAAAYAAWLGASDERFDYRLPDWIEWEHAARGGDGRTYPWGDAFSFALCAGGYSFPTTAQSYAPRPRVLEYLEDESPYGVRDLGGSIAEMIRGAPNVFLYVGGSGGFTDPDSFRAASAQRGESPSAHVGFRLVAEAQR